MLGHCWELSIRLWMAAMRAKIAGSRALLLWLCAVAARLSGMLLTGGWLCRELTVASALASTVMLLGFFYVLFCMALAVSMLHGCWQRSRTAHRAAVARSRAAKAAQGTGSSRHADRIAACR